MTGNLQCVKGNGGRLAAIAIKRFWLFEIVVDGDTLGDGLTQLWKEKHGHAEASGAPKRPKRVKTDADHKWCNGCEQALPVAAFSVDRSRARGLANRCRECAARQWKKNNRQVCKSCESYCVGQVCRRCLTIQIRIRDAEFDALATMPRMLAEARHGLEAFIESLSPKLSQSERLKLLLERVCGTSEIR